MNRKIMKQWITGLSVLAMVACNDDLLSENFNELKLEYHSGFTSVEDALSGLVQVNADNLTVAFEMEEAASTDQEVLCDGSFAITSTQLDELKEIVGATTYYVQSPSNPMFVTDMPILNLEIDTVDYEIRDPQLSEAGKFIQFQESCEIRLKLKEWVEASGLADDCSAEVATILFPETCSPLPHGPQ